jgi:hypothetical protein
MVFRDSLYPDSQKTTMFAGIIRNNRNSRNNREYRNIRTLRIISTMKVIEHIQQAQSTLVSFEILPPLKGKTISSIYDHLDPLMEFKPSFINVTYHRSETMFK